MEFRKEEEELLFSEHNEFNFESKLIRNDSKNIYNRLRSIVDDAEFVAHVYSLMPTLALVANERCGSWYIDRTKTPAYSAYFKSTDGHMRAWDLSVRRNNLHLVPVIAEHKGCIIVDSTRKGKKIPDALSKTIPIWCCAVNRMIARLEDTAAWDLSFYSPPAAVSRSEHAQIEALMDSFVDKLERSGLSRSITNGCLKKPLRPLWYTPESYQALLDSPPQWEEMPFYPIICLSASEAIPSGYQSRPGYLYVQGSGDDQEAWSMGLTAHLFWQHKDTILDNRDTCEQRVLDTVAKQQWIDKPECARIEPTCISIGNYGSGNQLMDFDLIINCDPLKHASCQGPNYLHVPIPEGKKGQIVFASAIDKVIEFAKEAIMKQKRILVHGGTGKDYAVGFVLSLLIHYYDTEGQLYQKEKPRADKQLIQRHLVRIIAHWEKASPSRTTLKRVNTHFMSHSTKSVDN
ncbi:initiator tRNA phosphoribosyl transferase [Choanephora cucurbitarum]|nr:initiator tRNA phosphoribosyl transferase [Choanephora cucurbitarum]